MKKANTIWRIDNRFLERLLESILRSTQMISEERAKFLVRCNLGRSVDVARNRSEEHRRAVQVAGHHGSRSTTGTGASHGKEPTAKPLFMIVLKRSKRAGGMIVPAIAIVSLMQATSGVGRDSNQRWTRSLLRNTLSNVIEGFPGLAGSLAEHCEEVTDIVGVHS